MNFTRQVHGRGTIYIVYWCRCWVDIDDTKMMILKYTISAVCNGASSHFYAIGWTFFPLS